MQIKRYFGLLTLCFVVLIFWLTFDRSNQINSAEPFLKSEEIFEPIDLHAHGASIVELPDGNLLAAWFEGSGERWADDVRIKGARYNQNDNTWGNSFELANTPGFPDVNPVLFIDQKEQLWLFWYTVMANLWETSLPKYRISTNYMMNEGPPEWDWQEVLHEQKWTEPEVMNREEPVEIHNSILWQEGEILYLFYTTMEGRGHEDSTLDLITSKDGGQNWSDPRLIREEWGWMFGTSPIRMSNGEVMVPVYKESSPNGVGFIISDDGFETWKVFPSEDPDDWPKPGIMASVVELRPGELFAYIRSSGQTLEIRSYDYGRTWTNPVETNLPNPYSRVAKIKLDSGNLLMAHNPTSRAPRTPLRLSLSEDEAGFKMVNSGF